MDRWLVGRDAELGRLARAAEDARSGACSVAVVTGPPGIGKSSLVESAAERAGLPHRYVVRGFPTERTIPLAAAAEVLREAAVHSGPASLLDELVRGRRGDAGELLPWQVFEATHQALGRRRPAHLVVDAVEWVDEQSRGLCHYLLRAAVGGGGRLAVTVAARADDPFTRSLLELVPRDHRHELALDVLAPDDAGTLVRQVAPDATDEDVARIHRRSGGNPFWVELLARADDGADAGRDLVAALLHGATPEEQDVVDALAVVGPRVGHGTLAAVGGVPPGRIAEAIDGLVGRGLVRRTPHGVALTHDLVGEALTSLIPPRRAAELHARAADLVDPDESDVRVLVDALRHRHAARQPVLGLAGRIARSPDRRLVGREGLATLTAIADDAGATGADEVAADADALAHELAVMAGELGQVETSLGRFEALAARLPPGRDRAWARVGAAKAAYQLRRGETAHAHLAAARRDADDDAALAIAIDARESSVRRWLDHEQEPARTLAERAVARARSSFDQGLDRRARAAYRGALGSLFDAALFGDEPERMLAVADELVAAAGATDDRARLNGLLSRATALRFLGRLEAAETPLRFAIEEASRRALPRTQAHATYWLAQTFQQQGRIRDAAAAIEEAAALFERVGRVSPMWPRIDRLRAWNALSGADWRIAVTELETVAAREDDAHFRLDAHHLIGTWLARVGDAGAADEIGRRVSRSVADADASGCRRCQREVRLLGAVAHARIGPRADAIALLRAADVSRRPPDPVTALTSDHATALLTEDRDDAVALLETTARRARELAVHGEALWMDLDRAGLLAERDPAAAVDVLEAVHADAERLGARTEARVSEERLRRLGVRTWSRGATAGGEGWEVLSEREAEIARLLLTGASNPEIAASLFVSRRTVERHVSNILAKTGTANRTEAVGVLTRLADLTHDRPGGAP